MRQPKEESRSVNVASDERRSIYIIGSVSDIDSCSRTESE